MDLFYPDSGGKHCDFYMFVGTLRRLAPSCSRESTGLATQVQPITQLGPIRVIEPLPILVEAGTKEWTEKCVLTQQLEPTCYYGLHKDFYI